MRDTDNVYGKNENPLVRLVETVSQTDAKEHRVFTNSPLRLDYIKFWADFSGHEVSSTLSEDQEDELAEILFAVKDGDPLAALDGLLFCSSTGTAPSDFLVNAVVSIFSAPLEGLSLGKKGSGNNPYAKARHSAIRHWRVDTVDRIIAAQEVQKSSQSENLRQLLLNLQLPPTVLRLLETMEINSIGRTKKEAFEIACLALQGSPAECTREWLERDYYKHKKSPPTYEPSQALLEALFVERKPRPFANFEDNALKTPGLDGVLQEWIPAPK
jgi:hypothetical protein